MVPVPPLAIRKLKNGGIFLHCVMANAGKTLFAQFTKVRSIHCVFYKCKTMDDDDQRKFIPQLAIDTE
jgi:hypothetical protein